MGTHATILGEEQLWSFANCPVQYDMAYNKKTIPKKPPMFGEHLQTVANAFFTNLMNGKILSGDELKRKWDSVCNKNPTIDSRKCIEGIGKLMLMYRWAENIELRILDVFVPYILLFKHNNGEDLFEVSGQIQTLAVTKGNSPELLVIDWGDKHTNQVRTDMNLHYTLQCYAYYMKTKKNLGIHVHNIKHNTEIYSYRGTYDYERLKTTVNNIGYSIKHRIFYPRENPMCVSCYVAGACKSWY